MPDANLYIVYVTASTTKREGQQVWRRIIENTYPVLNPEVTSFFSDNTLSTSCIVI